MNFFKKPVIFIALILLGSPIAGHAQYMFQLDPFFSYFRDLDRYEIGFSGILSSGFFSGAVPYGAYGAGQGDTNVTFKYSQFNFGAYVGTSIPFKATGHISLFAFDIGLNFNSLSWPNLNLAYVNNELKAPTKPVLNASTMQIGLPVGLEWKVGCDAIESKRLGLAASFGAGFIPQVSMTNVANAPADAQSGVNFNCAPYLKAEIAENLGFCAKLRFMATFGDVNMTQVNQPIAGVTEAPFKIVSQSNVYITLVIMPFSGRWKETAWWNTHDTYNQHDRLN